MNDTLTFAEYAPLARKTLKLLPFGPHMGHMGLGLVGEMGEFVDGLKKSLIYGKPLDAVNLLEEVGDKAWYAANLLEELMISPDVLQQGYAQGLREVTMMHAAGLPEQVDRDFLRVAHLLSVNFLLAATAVQIQCVPGVPDYKGVAPNSPEARDCIFTFGQCLGIVCGLFDIDMGSSLARNIAKLSARYPDKFTEAAALSRDLTAERTALEGGAAA